MKWVSTVGHWIRTLVACMRTSDMYVLRCVKGAVRWIFTNNIEVSSRTKISMKECGLY
jgi:hypothetical protein